MAERQRFLFVLKQFYICYYTIYCITTCIIVPLTLSLPLSLLIVPLSLPLTLSLVFVFDFFKLYETDNESSFPCFTQKWQICN